MNLLDSFPTALGDVTLEKVKGKIKLFATKVNGVTVNVAMDKVDAHRWNAGFRAGIEAYHDSLAVNPPKNKSK